MGKYIISLLKTENYQQSIFEQVVAKHFEQLGISIPTDASVVIKPNLIMRCRPDRAATTNPALVQAVVRQLQKMGVHNIIIAESPGGLYTPQLLMANYEQTGMQEVAQHTGIVLNRACGSQKLRCEQGELCREFDIIDPIAQADFVINLCKLKTHCMTTMSCGVKNLFGCIPGLLKPQLHYRFPQPDRFAQMLVDLSLLIRPGLTIVDAVDAMEGDGPTAGTPRHLGMTAAATAENLYALDLVMGKMIGLEPHNVSLLAQSVRRGLCPHDASEVEICGDLGLDAAVSDFQKPASCALDFADNLPTPIGWAIKRWKSVLAPHPQIRKRDCIGCGRCAESCPMSTIEIREKKARIDPSKCIRCFCCHEMCPIQAIDIKSMAFFPFFVKINCKPMLFML